MPSKLCLGCGRRFRTTRTGQSRCPACQQQRDRATTQAKRAQRPYTAAERDRRATVVAAWRDEYGDWCPGWNRDPHPATDLTADHPHPVGAGGSEDQPLAVLCRPCNSAKGKRANTTR